MCYVDCHGGQQEVYNMDKEFIEEQKSILVEKLNEINKSLEKKNVYLIETKKTILDEQYSGSDIQSDLASERIMLRIEEQLGVRETEILSQVLLSLQNIEKETYGICQHCRNPISEDRLEAIPYVQTCIECQKKLEDDFRKNNGERIHYYFKYIDKLDMGAFIRLRSEEWDRIYGRSK